MQDNLLTFKDTSVEQMQALLALALNVKNRHPITATP